MDIDAAQKECYQIAADHGWWDTADDCNVPTKLALVHSEVSEALECFRKGDAEMELYFQSRDPETKKLRRMTPSEAVETPGEHKPMGFGTELADVIIRCFDLAEWLQIDLDHIIRVKMNYNMTRPPRHGGKAV